MRCADLSRSAREYRRLPYRGTKSGASGSSVEGIANLEDVALRIEDEMEHRSVQTYKPCVWIYDVQ